MQRALAGELARRIVESVLRKAQQEGQLQQHFVLSASGARDAAAVLDAERRQLQSEQAERQRSEEQVLRQVLGLLDAMAQRAGREQSCTRLSPELRSFLLWLLQEGAGGGSGSGSGREDPPGAVLFRAGPPAPAPAPKPTPLSSQSSTPYPNATITAAAAAASSFNISDAARLAELDARERALRRLLSDLQLSPAPQPPPPPPTSPPQPSWLAAEGAAEGAAWKVRRSPSRAQQQGPSVADVEGQGGPDAERDGGGALDEGGGEGEGDDGARYHQRLRRRRRRPHRRRRGGPQWPSEEFRRLQELAARMRAAHPLQ